jgi:hypothetical protein
MARNVGDRYMCEKCGAVLVYEKPCQRVHGWPCLSGVELRSDRFLGRTSSRARDSLAADLSAGTPIDGVNVERPPSRPSTTRQAVKG